MLKGEKEVEIFADPREVLAEIGQVQGMSAYGDTDDLTRFISNQDTERVKKIFLVHGEYAVQKTFCDRLALKGFSEVEVPAMHQEYELFTKEQEKKIA